MRAVYQKSKNRMLALLMALLVLGMIPFGNTCFVWTASKAAFSVQLQMENKNMAKKTGRMAAGTKKKLKARAVRGSKSIKVSSVRYRSSNKEVVSVNQNGVVRAKAAGTAKITVKVKTGQGSKTAWMKIRVGKSETNQDQAQDKESAGEGKMKITAGDTVFYASFADNSSAEALKEMLADGPLTIHMSDYGDMEKVGPIGSRLPRNDETITTGPGDLILYQGNSLVIYYDTNTWDFTRIGKIEGVTRQELLAAFGRGDVTVTLSL